MGLDWTSSRRRAAGVRARRRSTTRCGCSTRSGTTGLPKAIVQSPGRDPARAPEDAAPAPGRAGRRPPLLVHHDRLDDVELHRLRAAHRGDRSCSTTARPATRTWTRCGTSRRARGMTTFGTSASYIGACMKAGVEPAEGRDLTALRAVGSTGSPLSPEGFRWVYEHVGADTWLFSTSGGTDLCTAFVGGVPRAAGLRGRAAGARAGRRDRVLGPGRPAAHRRGGRARDRPSRCPRCRSTSGTTRTARATARRTSTSTRASGATATGSRSPSAARRSSAAAPTRRSTAAASAWARPRSTARCWRVEDVTDALVVDVPREGEDAWMPLFVVLREGAALDRRRGRRRSARRVREDCSPRHVPSDVIQVAAVPRTLSGKVLELPVKRILMGTPAEQAASRDSLANPEALDAFVELASRRSRRRSGPGAAAARSAGSPPRPGGRA